MKISGYPQNDMGFTLEVSIFLHLLTAGDRTIFTDKIVITIKDNNILSFWTFTVTTNDKTYTPSIAVPFTQLSDKKRMFNFSQSYLSLKVACIYWTRNYFSEWRSLICTNVTVSDSAKNRISLGPIQLQPSEIKSLIKFGWLKMFVKSLETTTALVLIKNTNKI